MRAPKSLVFELVLEDGFEALEILMDFLGLTSACLLNEGISLIGGLLNTIDKLDVDVEDAGVEEEEEEPSVLADSLLTDPLSFSLCGRFKLCFVANILGWLLTTN